MWLLLLAIVVVGAAFALVSAMRSDLQKREASDQQTRICTPCCHCCSHRS